MGIWFTRQQAFKLLHENIKSEALRRHALAVEGVMRTFARAGGHDEERWGVLGLLHDIDYEQYPEQHCIKSNEILKEAGAGDALIRAVASHGWGICTDVEPVSQMEKTLYAIDELTGLIHAAAIMRPSRSVMDLELKSLKKKYKSNGFAAGVDRSIIERGAQMLGIGLDELMQRCIDGMREVAADIGLDGGAAERS